MGIFLSPACFGNIRMQTNRSLFEALGLVELFCLGTLAWPESRARLWPDSPVSSSKKDESLSQKVHIHCFKQSCDRMEFNGFCLLWLFLSFKKTKQKAERLLDLIDCFKNKNFESSTFHEVMEVNYQTPVWSVGLDCASCLCDWLCISVTCVWPPRCQVHVQDTTQVETDKLTKAKVHMRYYYFILNYRLWAMRPLVSPSCLWPFDWR